MNAHILGQRIACIAAGIPFEMLEFHKAATEALEDPSQPGYGAFQRVVSKIAADIYAGAEKRSSFEYQLFEKLSKSATWYPEFDAFIEPVLIVLGQDFNAGIAEETAVEEGHRKSAAPALAAYAVGKGVAWSPALMQYLLGAGVAGGAATGGAYWALNRDAATDDADLTGLHAKIKHYNHLSGQITDQLAAKPV
jgi:hypothetical protein